MQTIHVRTMGCALALLLVAGGCGGSGSDPLAPVTVNGTVMLQRHWGDVPQPAVGYTVEVVEHPAVTTDGSGRFSVANVARPYTVVIIDSVEPGALVYAGLTRPDPVLEGPRPPATVQYHADVSGTVSGGSGFPTPASHTTRVAFGQADRRSLGSEIASALDGSFTGASVWWGTGNFLTTTAMALQWEWDGAGVPVAFHGFGTALVDVADGGTTNGVVLPMASPSYATVSGTITAPPGYTLFASYLQIEMDAGPRFEVSMGDQPAASFSTAAPQLSGGTIWLLLQMTGPASESIQIWRAVEPGGASFAVQVPEATYQIEPLDGMTIDPYSVTFRAGGPSGAAWRAFYSPTFPNPGPYLILTLPEPTWTLPDLSAYGVNLATDTEYVWEVEALGPATVDDLCGDEPFASRSPHFDSLTDEYYFTTLP